MVSTNSKQALKKTLMNLVQQVSEHPKAWPFQQPVDTSIITDYLIFIKEPVDLSLVKTRVRHGAYSSVHELKATWSRCASTARRTTAQAPCSTRKSSRCMM